MIWHRKQSFDYMQKPDNFDEWAKGAVQVLEQHDMDWIKENQPAMWIYLQMVE